MKMPRIRLKINLRGLILITLGFGLWFGFEENKARNQQQAVKEIEKYNGYILYNDEYKNGQDIKGVKWKLLSWFRKVAGTEYFHDVACVRYIDQPISDATLAAIDNVDQIEELAFLRRVHHSLPIVEPPPGQAGLTEAGLARLGKLTRLRRLDIEEFHELDGKEGSLAKASFKDLGHARNLEELRLFGTGIKDQAMPDLRSMRGVRKLDLWCNQLTGTFLRSIRGSTDVEVLELYENPISIEGLDNIGTLQNLQELNLTSTEVDDDGLSHLAGLANLKELRLDRTKVTGAGLVHLRAMQHLETLILEECAITGPGLKDLRALPALKVLGLGGTRVNDEDLRALEGMSQLEFLTLFRTPVTDAGLVHLQNLKRLKELSLAVTTVTQAGADRLRSELPGIVEFDR